MSHCYNVTGQAEETALKQNGMTSIVGICVHFLHVLVGSSPPCVNGKGKILSYLDNSWSCVSLGCLLKSYEKTVDSLF